MSDKIKSWILPLFGIVIMVMDFAYFFGLIDLPNPEAVSKDYQLLIAFLIGLFLLVTPLVKIQKKADTVIDKVIKK